MKLILATGVSILAMAGVSHAQTQSAQPGFCIHGQGLTLPIGKFLLIRKGNQIGALRLTRITPDTKTQPRAKEWIGTVGYETFFVDGGRPLTDSSATEILGDLHFGRMKGFGFHYSWQSGNMKARVGPWNFLFFDQNGMFMTAYDRLHGFDYDSGLEFAPTAITELARLNPNDNRLHWYKRDPNADIPCPVPLPN